MFRIVILFLFFCLTSKSIFAKQSEAEERQYRIWLNQERSAQQNIDLNKTKQKRVLAATTLPTTPEEPSYSRNVSRTNSDAITITVWRSGGTTYLRATPFSGTPFLCSSSFAVIQNAKQFDSIKLTDGYSTSSFCNDLFIPTTFILGQYSFATQFDSSQPFQLIYKGIYNNYSLDVGTSNSAAFTPETGWYWNASESGRGFAIEIKNGRAFIAGFMYEESGKPIWFITSGNMASSNKYIGTWVTYGGGQTLSGNYRSASVTNSNNGSVIIEWTSATTAQLTLPTGRIVQLTRFSDF